MTIKFKRLNKDTTIPNFANVGDSGMDVRSIEKFTIPAHSYHLFKTGIAAEIPEGYEIQVRPRSGMQCKKGVVAGFGTVDSGYRGEIGVVLYNHNGFPYDVEIGDRIAQLVVAAVPQVTVEEVDEFSGDTERGSKGFGSSGK